VTYLRLPEPYTSEELDRLERASGDDMVIWACCSFLRETGLRIHEATMVPRDVAETWFPGGPTPIFGAKEPRTYRLVGKGNKQRVIVLSKKALVDAKILLGARGIRRPHRLIPWSDRRLQERLRELGQKAGVDCRAHRFRHTHCQELVDAGAPIHVVADMMGHSDISTTRIYFQSSPTAKLDGLGRRERFLKRRGG
jgi:site-specific recombinase XerD